MSMIRVLVAEDSVTTREFLVAMLRSDPKIEVVGEAKDGLEAIEMTRRLRPNVITMDIRMPRMDGLEATKQIMISIPTPIVIVSGSLEVRDVEVSMQALRAGALTLLAKPAGPASPKFEKERREFVETVKAMSQVKVVRRWRDRQPAESGAERRALGGSARVRVVAIAASTGGPAALQQTFSALEGDFPVPILVVQHIARGFVEGLASWLSAVCPLRVKVAEEGEPLSPRTVYLAPDERHLGVSSQASVSLSRTLSGTGFCPSATFLFESVARVFGTSALAVVLTGMGQDGLDGLMAVRRAGGRIIAQDEATSVVFGMPGVAVEAGLADWVLPLPEIAPRLMDMVRMEEGET
jgi:two-component system, chemotaxis family, protein-glutamate methylesterase/glutaminase